jgi:hypothetical protein
MVVDKTSVAEREIDSIEGDLNHNESRCVGRRSCAQELCRREVERRDNEIFEAASESGNVGKTEPTNIHTR